MYYFFTFQAKLIAMNLKIIFLITVFSLISSAFIQAQTMKFCTSQPADGDCYSVSKTEGTDSTEVYILIDNKKEINSSRVDLKIYGLANGAEEFDATIDIGVQNDWDWFFRGVIFYNSGIYKVYAYKADGTFICSGNIDITINYSEDDFWFDY